jgi:hypothetical protein
LGSERDWRCAELGLRVGVIARWLTNADRGRARLVSVKDMERCILTTK